MTGRREVLMLGTAAGATRPPLAQAAVLDAELITACRTFDELEQAYAAVNYQADHGHLGQAEAATERERIQEAQERLVRRMVDLSASTREGMAARAASLALWDSQMLKPGGDDVGERLTRAIVRDLLTGSTLA